MFRDMKLIAKFIKTLLLKNGAIQNLSTLTTGKEELSLFRSMNFEYKFPGKRRAVMKPFYSKLEDFVFFFALVTLKFCLNTWINQLQKLLHWPYQTQSFFSYNFRFDTWQSLRFFSNVRKRWTRYLLVKPSMFYHQKTKTLYYIWRTHWHLLCIYQLWTYQKLLSSLCYCNKWSKIFLWIITNLKEVKFTSPFVLFGCNLSNFKL